MGQITKNVLSRDQFKKYETETGHYETKTETETETETLKIGLETKTGLETFITGIWYY